MFELLIIGLCFLGVVGWVGIKCASGPWRVRRNRGKRLIGIMGNAGHGKDTIADMLVENFGFIKEAYAKPIKDVLKILFLFSDDQLYGHLKNTIDNRWGVSPRQVMQFFGTKVGREEFSKLMPHIGEEFWISHFRYRLSNLLELHKMDPANHTSNVVVADVRLADEAAFIKSRGGFVIKVHRPDAPELQIIDGEERKVASADVAKHRSETEMNSIHEDILILNNGTLTELKAKIDNIMLTIPHKRPKTPKAE